MTTGHAAGAVPQPVTRPIPKTGERLPVIGLGTYVSFDLAPGAPERREAQEALKIFSDMGGRMIDSSPMYGQAEAAVGDTVAALGGKLPLFYATKVWTSGRDAGIRQMETSMKRLRVDTLDLMQVHNLLDLDTHARTLREWKRAGRLRYLGITHYHSGAYRELAKLLRTREWDFVQLNYSLAEHEAEAELLPLAADTGTAVIVNRPFAQGGLFARVQGKALPDWAAEVGCASWAQFFLKWIVSHPAVTCAIPATRRSDHMRDNVGAGVGPLPDAAARRRMAQHFAQL
jgi:diketogulonate reductase-like aldo/keto reductase